MRMCRCAYFPSLQCDDDDDYADLAVVDLLYASRYSDGDCRRRNSCHLQPTPLTRHQSCHSNRYSTHLQSHWFLVVRFASRSNTVSSTAQLFRSVPPQSTMFRHLTHDAPLACCSNLPMATSAHTIQRIIRPTRTRPTLSNTPIETVVRVPSIAPDRLSTASLARTRLRRRRAPIRNRTISASNPTTTIRCAPRRRDELRCVCANDADRAPHRPQLPISSPRST